MSFPDWWPSDNSWIINDSLPIMKLMPNKCIDLILTDPPYGIDENNKKNLSRGKLAKPKDYGHYNWDKERIKKEYFDEIIRISKNQIIFGGNYYTDYLPPSSCWIIWDKDNTGDFADCEMAWGSFKKSARLFKYRWNGMLQEHNDRRREKREHPTQKPVALFEWILNKYSNPGDIVFDPFLGSGTTLAACRKTGRIGIGCEINSKYEVYIVKKSMRNISKLDWFGIN